MGATATVASHRETAAAQERVHERRHREAEQVLQADDQFYRMEGGKDPQRERVPERPGRVGDMAERAVDVDVGVTEKPEARRVPDHHQNAQDRTRGNDREKRPVNAQQAPQHNSPERPTGPTPDKA
jgi:hypothetical protein